MVETGRRASRTCFDLHDASIDSPKRLQEPRRAAPVTHKQDRMACLARPTRLPFF
jgi:hypothetical protein